MYLSNSNLIHVCLLYLHHYLLKTYNNVLASTSSAANLDSGHICQPRITVIARHTKRSRIRLFAPQCQYLTSQMGQTSPPAICNCKFCPDKNNLGFNEDCGRHGSS